MDLLFRKRVGFNEKRALTFTELPELLLATGLTLPFENLAVVEGRALPISKENLVAKLLTRKQGGLCYELNPLLYFFLLDNGFDVTMVRGIVFSPETRAFVGTGHTHVTLLLRHQGSTYVVDTGFGGYLPLRPVPMNGEAVISNNGEFRITPAAGENKAQGDYVFELKQRYKDQDWRIGYVFDSGNAITPVECEEIRQVIANHPESPFNKRPLVVRLTEHGYVTLTDTSLIITEFGQVTKRPVNSQTFPDLLAEHFQIATET